jgi:hypothetical protein
MARDHFLPRISRTTRGLLLACWLGATALGSGERLAWGETTPTAEQLWDWYGEASRLHDQGKVNEAWNLYKKIWKYKQTYDVAASMGEICARRAQFALAARYYRFAIETVVPTQSPDFVKAVNEEYSKARREITEVEVKTTPQHVKGLRIFDEGNDVELEQPLFLEVGNHRLRAEAEGYATVTKFISAQPGAVIEWEVEMTPLSAVVPDDPRTSKTRHPGIVFGVGGALTLGLGAGAYLMERQAKEQYDDGERAGAAIDRDGCTDSEAAQCKDLADAYDRAQRSERTAIALAGGAGLAALATVIVYLVWEDEEAVSVSLEQTPGNGWKVGYGLAF